MRSCWEMQPTARPSFDALEMKISKMLEKHIVEHYINLNRPYSEANAISFSAGQTDYSAVLDSRRNYERSNNNDYYQKQ